MVAWGVIATLTSPLGAIIVSGALLLPTPLLLPKQAPSINSATASPADAAAA